MSEVVDDLELFRMREDNDFDGHFEEGQQHFNVDTEEERKDNSENMNTPRDKKKRKAIETQTKLAAAKMGKTVSIKSMLNRLNIDLAKFGFWDRSKVSSIDHMSEQCLSWKSSTKRELLVFAMLIVGFVWFE